MSVDESTGERILHHRLLDFGHNAVAIKVRAALCAVVLILQLTIASSEPSIGG